VTALNDPEIVGAEYESLDRLRSRRLDATGWVRESGEPVATVLAAVAEAGPRRVLDAGCGDGRIARLLTSPEVVCVDSAAAAVEAARALDLSAVRADIEALPFADGSFDVVMCNWTLYHLSDLDRGLGELRRVLRDGGRFVGAYNCDGHLDEVWAAVGYRAPHDSFNGHNGQAFLARHFGRVERRDTNGHVVWLARDDLQAYLDAFSHLSGQRLVAPESPYPFRATRRNCVLVAER
jgi:SAM-dependent methyltransferase